MELVLQSADPLRHFREVAELKRRIFGLDLTSSNPKLINIVEAQMLGWIQSRDEKIKMKYRNGSPQGAFQDKYGSLADFPTLLQFQGDWYVPDVLPFNVYHRTELGMAVVDEIIKSRREDPLWGDSMKEGLASTLDGPNDLDEIALRCACGEHEQTYRQFAETFIAMDPESLPLQIGWSTAIMSLYAGGRAVYGYRAPSGVGEKIGNWLSGRESRRAVKDSMR